MVPNTRIYTQRVMPIFQPVLLRFSSSFFVVVDIDIQYSYFFTHYNNSKFAIGKKSTAEKKIRLLSFLLYGGGNVFRGMEILNLCGV